jgi:hypothetical protein
MDSRPYPPRNLQVYDRYGEEKVPCKKGASLTTLERGGDGGGVALPPPPPEHHSISQLTLCSNI